MFFGVFVRLMISATILYFSMRIVARRGAVPDFQDVFFAAVGITFVSVLLVFLLFPTMRYFSLIPIFAVNVLILMKFLDMGVLTAVVVLVIYEAANMFLPF